MSGANQRRIDLIDRWVRPEISQLSAYAVHDAKGLIKLDAMENPFGWPEPMRQAWMSEISQASLNRYPDAAADDLKAAMRRFMGLNEAAPVVLGNGSDELIQMLMMLVGGQGRCVMAPDPTFVMYRMIAAYTGTAYESVPLDEHFQLDADRFCAAMRDKKPAIVFLASPNNPTANAFSEAAMRRVISEAPGLVVIDEAYAPFFGSPLGPTLMSEPNVLVMRTLSKLGLAGLRVGLVTGAAQWIEQLEKLRLPYNLNVLSQLSATFALNYQDVITRQIDQLVSERAELLSELAEVDGIHVWPSDANFLILRCSRPTADEVFDGLLQRGILIKRLHGSHPALAGCLRVTVGSPTENRAFMDALRDVLEKG